MIASVKIQGSQERMLRVYFALQVLEKKTKTVQVISRRLADNSSVGLCKEDLAEALLLSGQEQAAAWITYG